MTNSTNTVYATKRLICRMYDDPEVQKEANASSDSLIGPTALSCSCAAFIYRVGHKPVRAGTRLLALSS